MIDRREARAAREAERRWAAPKWSAADRKLVENSIYCAKRSLPTGGDAWDAYVDAHDREVVLADLDSYASMRERSVEAAAERLPGMRAELEALVLRLGDCARTQTEADRLQCHEKSAMRDAAKARAFRRLIVKIECHGLPPKE